MRVEDSQFIKASRETVWQFITDPEAVCRCAPGFQSLAIVVPGQAFRATAVVGFGALRVEFNVLVTYAQLAPPELANFRATATAAGGNGEVRVTSHVSLTDLGESGTKMDWGANIVFFGMIAGLAERLGTGLAKQLTTKFFECVKQKLET